MLTRWTSLVAFVLLAGCGSAPTIADMDGRVVCDSPQMDAVERDARLRGAEVHWVNCPQATLRVVRGPSQ